MFTVSPLFEQATDRHLATAYWVGMHLQWDAEAGAPEHEANDLVKHLEGMEPGDQLGDALVEISTELQRRGLTECFECTCFSGLHFAGDCGRVSLLMTRGTVYEHETPGGQLVPATLLYGDVTLFGDGREMVEIEYDGTDRNGEPDGSTVTTFVEAARLTPFGLKQVQPV